MLVHSIVRTNPDAEIIQCTDAETAAIPGTSRVVRTEGNPANLMTYRIAAFAALQLRYPALYLDTDMLVLDSIDPTALLGTKEVLFCRRDFDCDSLHSGSQRGVEFPEHRGRPLGVVYPYVACATISKSFEFWTSLRSIIESLDERFHRWYGDQEAMRIWVENDSHDRHGFLPESDFACLPERQDHLQAATILHFKGHLRKPMMSRFYKVLFMDKNST